MEGLLYTAGYAFASALGLGVAAGMAWVGAQIALRTTRGEIAECDARTRRADERLDERVEYMKQTLRAFEQELDDSFSRLERKRAQVVAAEHRKNAPAKKDQEAAEAAEPAESLTPQEQRDRLWSVPMFGSGT